MILQETLDIATRGRGTQEISAPIAAIVSRSGINTGLAHVFICHTSASLLLSENADPDVRRDLERFLQRIAPDGAPWYAHDAEGPDDMAAHIRSVLTASELTLPVRAGRLALGTWQGVYLWEHRHAAHRRRVIVTVHGEAA